MIRKLIAAVSLALAFALNPVVCEAKNTTPTFSTQYHPQGKPVIREAEGGTRHDIGVFKVINLKGTWYEMGRQYGALMSKELRHVYEFGIVKSVAGGSEAKLNEIRREAEPWIIGHPLRKRELIKGMADGSGLKEEEIRLIDLVEVFGFPACSGLAAWGDNLSDGSAVYGRNYDYTDWFHELHDDLVVAVYHPADGSPSVATVGYCGESYAVNGMNEHGIFLELNNGSFSYKMPQIKNRIFSPWLLFTLLFNAATMEEVDAFMHTVRSSDSYIIGLCDEKSARAYEWTGFETRRTPQQNGLLALTNHFQNPEWNVAAPTDKSSFSSQTRLRNLHALAEQNKGKFSAETMRRILDTRLEDGGATLGITVYQMTVVPAERKIWLKIPGVQEWTLIDLKPFFNSMH